MPLFNILFDKVKYPTKPELANSAYPNHYRNPMQLLKPFTRTNYLKNSFFPHNSELEQTESG